MSLFERYLHGWNLTPDGAAMTTPSSELLPVRQAGEPLMLKLARIEEERRGGGLMAWWEGVGAARVVARNQDALLLERALGPRSLTSMATGGHDDEASRIVCAVAATLHAPRTVPAPKTLVPLHRWFADLEPAANRHGGFYKAAWVQASLLLASPQDETVLHGDLHHGNVLDFGERGWLAIDPKGLIGERGFDFANLLLNPDAATATVHFVRRIEIVSETARIDRKRLLRWTLAWSGLSATWCLEDGIEPDLTVAALAAQALDRS